MDTPHDNLTSCHILSDLWEHWAEETEEVSVKRLVSVGAGLYPSDDSYWAEPLVETQESKKDWHWRGGGEVVAAVSQQRGGRVTRTVRRISASQKTT